MPQKNPELDNYAFMPTSNDALHSPLNEDPPSPRTRAGSTISPDGRPNGLNGRGSTSSSTSGFTRSGRASLPQPTILERERVPSASNVRSSSATGIRSANDENFWYNLYQKEKQAHHDAACTWNEERKRLVRERDELLSELSSLKGQGLARQISGASASGIENDKVFYDPSTVERATEGLRSLSVVESLSGRSSRDSSQTRDPSGANATSNNLSSWSGLLPSISEERGSVTELPLKSVRLAPGPGEPISIQVEASSPGYITQIEDPVSPPTTRMPEVGSPLPPNFTIHAGHTPMAAIARSGRESFIDEPPQKPIRALFTGGLDGMGGVHDGDKELHSPKMLPPTPDKGATMLDALTDKLKDVSEHPEQHQPDAVRYAAMMDEEEERQKHDEEAKRGDATQQPGQAIDAAIRGTDDELGGVKLKMKKSLNFGSELGRLH